MIFYFCVFICFVVIIFVHSNTQRQLIAINKQKNRYTGNVQLIVFVDIFLDGNIHTHTHTLTHTTDKLRDKNLRLEIDINHSILFTLNSEERKNVMSQLMIRELDLFFNLTANQHRQVREHMHTD